MCVNILHFFRGYIPQPLTKITQTLIYNKLTTYIWPMATNILNRAAITIIKMENDDTTNFRKIRDS